MTVVVNSRDDFTLENYQRVTMGGESVAIGPEARRTMAEGRAGFLRLLESDRTQFIYGVTSSYGPRAKLTIPPGQQRAHARAFGFRGNWGRGFGGGYLDERVVRGILFARLANFVAGNSKARPIVAERLAALLDGPLPRVPLDGEVGAGEVLPMAHVLSGFRRDDLEEGETNPLLNGSPVSAALAADTALQARHRLDHAEQVFALSVEAFGAPLDSYDDVLDDLWGDEDEASALTALRRHLEGASPHGRRSAAVPASYRVLGRVLGQAHRAVTGVEEAARVSLRSVTDNPVYVPPDEGHPLGRLLDRRLPQCHGVPGAERARGRLGRPDPADPAARDGARTVAASAPPAQAPRSAAAAATGLEPVLGALVEDARAAAMPRPASRGGQRPARRRVLADLQRLSLAQARPQSASTARWPCSPPGPARHCSPPDASPLPLQDLLVTIRAIFPRSRQARATSGPAG
jgi:histidine ammonia-lyase